MGNNATQVTPSAIPYADQYLVTAPKLTQNRVLTKNDSTFKETV
jgi:hypothetical protein